MHHFRRYIGKEQSFSASAERRKKERYYLKNGTGVLEELLPLCNGKCRIPLRYFSAAEIEKAIKHTEKEMSICESNMLVGLPDKRRVLVRFNNGNFILHNNLYLDIAITCQMSHLKNVLRLVGCCLEFEEPVMVYEYVDAITLEDLLFSNNNDHDHASKRLLSWGSRLRIANEVASAVVFLHSEFPTPIIHRNLKPSKVIINQNNGVAKLVDFSWSVSLPPGELEVIDAVCGTRRYIDPEYLNSCIVTQKIDVYSFGVVLLELLTRKRMNSCLDGKILAEEDLVSESNIEEGNVLNVGSPAIAQETVDFENLSPNAVVSNIEEINNVMDIVDHATSEETLDFEDCLPFKVVKSYIGARNVMDILDPAILEEYGIEIGQQLEDYFSLVKKCTASKGEDRPYMIHVAKELSRIEKYFRVLTLGRN